MIFPDSDRVHSCWEIGCDAIICRGSPAAAALLAAHAAYSVGAPLPFPDAGAMLDPPTRNPYARATAQLPEVRELAAYVYTDLS